MNKNIFLILFIIINLSTKLYCHDFKSINKKILNTEKNERQKFAYFFINNELSQHLFINDILFISHFDVHSSDTPKKTTTIVHRNETHHPIIPSIKTMHRYGQEIETKEINERFMYIIRSKDDTGLLIKYYFHKNKFWNLYMIEDESM